MSKRKAAVNDIIYELDNEDIVVSSDDEVKEPKINRLETVISTNTIEIDTKAEKPCIEVIEVDKSCESINNISSPANMQNGGKSSDDLDNSVSQNGPVPQQNKDEVDCVKKPNTDCCKATILNEDIVIDSPGNSDLGVEGCENRTPLVTVRFRDNGLAKTYKEKIKAFMLNLIKLHEGEIVASENETDLELDIWPEDLTDEPAKEKEENNLFFVDTDPGYDRVTVIPRYSQTSTVISNAPDKEPSPPPARRAGPTCFNCDGDHPLRDCQKPRDFLRIANKRKSLPVRLGRYHVEDEQKFGHLIPGRISGQLRHALGLKRHELPLHIYKMRVMGYPPGWLEEARISHSGITMFDSLGNAILEPEDEEGEVCEPGSKDKFDIKKILDFPGFNVPPSPRYKEEAHLYGLPPMSEQDSKLSMLQFLAPNAMKAYKRKRLTMFPSAASNDTTLAGQAEMDLDSGDEAAEFPSVPPLPDEAPPPPLPPPPPPPMAPPPLPSPPAEEQKPPAPDDKSSEDDVEVIRVLKVGDIPVPLTDLIVIDEVESEVDKPKSSDPTSPSLEDLEAKKQLLLDALDVTGDTTVTQDITISDTTETEDALNKTFETIDEIADLTCDDVKDTDEPMSVDVEAASDVSVEKIVEGDGNVLKVDTERKATVEKVAEGEANVEKVAEGEEKVEKVAEEEATIEKVAEGKATIEKVAEGEATVEKVAEGKATVEKVAEAGATVEKAAEGEATVEKVAEGKATVEKVAEGKATVEEVAGDDVNGGEVADSVANGDKVANGDANGEKITNGETNTMKVDNGDLSDKKIDDNDGNGEKVSDGNSDKVAETDTHIKEVVEGDANVEAVAEGDANVENIADNDANIKAVSEGDANAEKVAEAFLNNDETVKQDLQSEAPMEDAQSEVTEQSQKSESKESLVVGTQESLSSQQTDTQESSLTSQQTMDIEESAPSSGPTMDIEESAPSSRPTMDIEEPAPSSGPTMDIEESAPSSRPTMDIEEPAPSSRPTMDIADSAPLSQQTMDIDDSAPAQLTIDTQESPLSSQIPINTQQSAPSSQITIDTVESPSTSRQTSDSQESAYLKHNNSSQASPDVRRTPDNKAGHVKGTEYGTPVMNIASSYCKLPSDDKFAKDICDIINFENLPNSTGKYKQISALLRKVKNEVDRIQDS